MPHLLQPGFALLLSLAICAGLGASAWDAPNLLCRPRVDQAAGNVSKMGRINEAAERLLFAQVRHTFVIPMH